MIQELGFQQSRRLDFEPGKAGGEAAPSRSRGDAAEFKGQDADEDENRFLSHIRYSFMAVSNAAGVPAGTADSVDFYTPKTRSEFLAINKLFSDRVETESAWVHRCCNRGVEEFDASYFQSSFPEPTKFFLTACKANETIVGAMTAWICGRIPILRFDVLAVAEGYEGRGIGSELLEKTEQLGRDHGCSVIKVVSAASALGFYVRKGYMPEPFKAFEPLSGLDWDHLRQVSAWSCAEGGARGEYVAIVEKIKEEVLAAEQGSRAQRYHESQLKTLLECLSFDGDEPRLLEWKFDRWNRIADSVSLFLKNGESSLVDDETIWKLFRYILVCTNYSLINMFSPEVLGYLMSIFSQKCERPDLGEKESVLLNSLDFSDFTNLVKDLDNSIRGK